MGLTLTPADLTPFATIETAKAEAMIADAIALAEQAAPCLGADNLDAKKAAAAKAILRGAILRWNESGQGGRTQINDTAGPFSHTEAFDNSQPRRTLFWPSEIEHLQKLCREPGGTAWGYDTAPAGVITHADICAAHFGANYCSCGAILAGGEPLWENNP